MCMKLKMSDFFSEGSVWKKKTRKCEKICISVGIKKREQKEDGGNGLRESQILSGWPSKLVSLEAEPETGMLWKRFVEAMLWRQGVETAGSTRDGELSQGELRCNELQLHPTRKLWATTVPQNLSQPGAEASCSYLSVRLSDPPPLG